MYAQVVVEVVPFAKGLSASKMSTLHYPHNFELSHGLAQVLEDDELVGVRNVPVDAKRLQIEVLAAEVNSDERVPLQPLVQGCAGLQVLSEIEMEELVDLFVGVEEAASLDFGLGHQLLCIGYQVLLMDLPKGFFLVSNLTEKEPLVAILIIF